MDYMNYSHGEKNDRTRIVRAGKRTYFLDIKTTKQNDYYLTITEKKETYSEHGEKNTERHMLFLFHEDFQKFATALKEVMQLVEDETGEKEPSSFNQDNDM